MTMIASRAQLLRLGHVELFVRDPQKSLEFYQGVLGFELVDVQHERFVWLRLGDLDLLLRPGKAGTPVSHYRHGKAGLVLYTDDVDTTVQELQARGLIFRGNDGSSRCPTFTDLDGHWFQLANPADHADG